MHCCAEGATGRGMHSPDCEMVSGNPCPNHKIISHDREGLLRWCDFCGRDEGGKQIRPGAGGWGTPSRISR